MPKIKVESADDENYILHMRLNRAQIEELKLLVAKVAISSATDEWCYHLFCSIDDANVLNSSPNLVDYNLGTSIGLMKFVR